MVRPILQLFERDRSMGCQRTCPECGGQVSLRRIPVLDGAAFLICEECDWKIEIPEEEEIDGRHES